ncbi:MAG: OmpH family outer membrane protein [Candidatus Marinimicrobia bacterium]|nr:OmpH family outer membrane protein [Candidatus Neomarinimicrobiota bacterium]MDP6789112.1 OmpH family outer membrane protein [Candidatus Neomarinimicrobiota bacterium]MDP7072014.1 OmpH family outer membrane protein [Candidatus Neomarinimicrobiota bacterium]
MTHSFKLTLLTLGFVLISGIANAQGKIGYVQSDRIRAEYEEFKDAESQLQTEYQKVQVEYRVMLTRLDSLNQAFEAQRLMSSPEWRREKEQEIKDTERMIQVFQAQKIGPQGELYSRQAQLEFDILTKVKRAVDKVAAVQEFDYIIDGSVALLYGNPKHDLTDDVLAELRKYSLPESSDSQ